MQSITVEGADYTGAGAVTAVLAKKTGKRILEEYEEHEEVGTLRLTGSMRDQSQQKTKSSKEQR